MQVQSTSIPVSCRVVSCRVQPHPSRGKGAGAYRNPATTTVCNVLYVCTVQSKYRIGNGEMEMEKENGKWKCFCVPCGTEY